MNNSLRDVHLVASPDTLHSALETWFFQNELLGGIPYTLDTELGALTDSVIIYIGLHQPVSVQLIQSLRQRGNKFVFLHMGDELGNHDCSIYDYCDLIIRNYLHAHIFENERFRGKLIWIPNGFRTGVGPREPSVIKLARNRRWLSCFLGWLDNSKSYNNERQLFKQAALKCSENLFLNESAGWAGGYNIGLYSAVMENSIFTPCPAGNCPDSIRLYDAMELGGIPICLNHLFINDSRTMIGPPFPILDCWDDLPDFLSGMRNEYARDPLVFDNLQAATIQWWQHVKRKIASHIEERLMLLRVEPFLRQ